jgi:hypothetical protein
MGAKLPFDMRLGSEIVCPRILPQIVLSYARGKSERWRKRLMKMNGLPKLA